MAYGADVFFSVPGMTRGELRMGVLDTYGEAELPPEYILKMITIHGIDLLGLEDERGRIKEGLAERSGNSDAAFNGFLIAARHQCDPPNPFRDRPIRPEE